MLTLLSVVLCIHRDDPVNWTKNYGVFSCTQGNETLEKETNPYFVTLLLMYLAKGLTHSGPTFFKVPSPLRASASLFLNRCDVDSTSAGWSHSLIARTSGYISPGLYMHLWHWWPFLPHETTVFFFYWLLVFLLPLWLPLLSVSNKLFFCLLRKQSWPLGFSSWTESILYVQPVMLSKCWWFPQGEHSPGVSHVPSVSWSKAWTAVSETIIVREKSLGTQT